MLVCEHCWKVVNFDMDMFDVIHLPPPPFSYILLVTLNYIACILHYIGGLIYVYNPL